MWTAADLTRPWNDPLADFDLALRSESSTVLLARDGTLTVGTVMVGFDGHRGWVYYLAVADERRREGIGRLLMQEAESWLRRVGAPKIQLMVRRDNAFAKGFYAALGYEEQDVATIGRRLD